MTSNTVSMGALSEVGQRLHGVLAVLSPAWQSYDPDNWGRVLKLGGFFCLQVGRIPAVKSPKLTTFWWLPMEVLYLVYDEFCEAWSADKPIADGVTCAAEFHNSVRICDFVSRYVDQQLPRTPAPVLPVGLAFTHKGMTLIDGQPRIERHFGLEIGVKDSDLQVSYGHNAVTALNFQRQDPEEPIWQGKALRLPEASPPLRRLVHRSSGLAIEPQRGILIWNVGLREDLEAQLADVALRFPTKGWAHEQTTYPHILAVVPLYGYDGQGRALGATVLHAGVLIYQEPSAPR